MQRSAHLSKALRPKNPPEAQVSFRLFLGMLGFSRYLFLVLAFCVLAIFQEIVPIARRVLLRAQLSEPTGLLMLLGVIFCSAVLGFQLGKRFWRSLVQWYPVIADEPPKSYWAMLGSYWRALSNNVLSFGLSAALVLAVATVIMVSVSCRSVWGPGALLSVLGLFSIVIGVLAGLCLGIFYYGDWVASCIKRLKKASP